MAPIIKFTGDNYHLWVEDAKIKLLERNLISAATDGSFLAPPDEALKMDDKSSRERNALHTEMNATAKFKILESIPRHLRQPSWAEPKVSAYEIWSQLYNQYGGISLAQIGQCRREFALTKWKFHNELPQIMNRLERLQYQTSTAAMGAISDQELCTQISLYYPPSWEVKMTQLRSDPTTLYNWSLLKPELLAEFQARNSYMANNNINNSKSHKKPYSSNSAVQPKKHCDHCQAAGRTKTMNTHNSEDCYIQNKGYKKKAENQPKTATIGNMGKFTQNSVIIDTGASIHTTHDKSFLYSIQDKPITTSLPNGSKITSTTCGKMDLLLADGSIGTLNNVYFNPRFQNTLLSFPLMHKVGCNISSKPGKIIISNSDNTPIIVGKLRKGLYISDSKPIIQGEINLNQSSPNCSINRLHQRLGHINEKTLKKVEPNVKQISITGKLDSHCEVCAITKSHHLPYHEQVDEPNNHPVGRLDFDTSGPHRHQSLEGNKYYIVAILKKFKFIFIKPLKTKAEGPDFIISVCNWIYNQKQTYPSEIRSDNASEYQKVENFANSKGIEYSYAAPEAHNQNPNAERIIRTINETASALLRDANVPLTYWDYAVQHVEYIKNRTPVNKANYKTPYELFFGNQPTLKYARRFGCRCYVILKTKQSQKIGDKSQVGRNLGNTKTSYIVELDDGKIIYSRDVTFNEDIPKFSYDSSTNDLFYDDDESSEYNPLSDSQSNTSTQSSTSFTEDYLQPSLSDDDDEIYRIEEFETPKTRNFGQINLILNESEDTAVNEIPMSISEALKIDNWKSAIIEELKGLLSKHCFSKFFGRPSTKPISIRCVFTKKNNQNRIKYKARIVARGFLQRYGIDYYDTYAGVASQQSIRLLFSLYACFGGSLHHYDIKQAFINGTLKEEVFVKFPKDLANLIGTLDPNLANHDTFRLNRSLYGLKQAGNVWSEKLNHILTNSGFSNSKIDPYFYVYRNDNETEFLVTYVDDIINLKIKSSREWMKEFGKEDIKINEVPLNESLIGFHVLDQEDKLQLHQLNYIETKAREFSAENSKNQFAPVLENLPSASPDIAHVPYQGLIGSLQYAATCSRPDIAFATSYMARFNLGYLYQHYKAAKTILKYLYTTKDLKLTYNKSTANNQKLTIKAYSDSDFASSKDPNDKRRSVSGFLISIQNGPVSWSSKRQTITASSAYEAELIAAHLCVKQILTITNLLKELGIEYETPVKLLMDNQAAIKLLKGPVVTTDSKSLDVKIFSIKDHVESGLLFPEYVNTSENVADMLTKCLNPMKLKTLNELANIIKP